MSIGIASLELLYKAKMQSKKNQVIIFKNKSFLSLCYFILKFFQKIMFTEAIKSKMRLSISGYDESNDLVSPKIPQPQAPIA